MCLFKCQTEVHTDAEHIHAFPYSLKLITYLIKNFTFDLLPFKFHKMSCEGKQLQFCCLPNIYFEKKFPSIMVN